MSRELVDPCDKHTDPNKDERKKLSVQVLFVVLFSVFASGLSYSLFGGVGVVICLVVGLLIAAW